MRLLLDTHIFLWFISKDERLPEPIKEQIQDSENDVYLSVVSLWEIITKSQIGKLALPEAAENYIPAQRERHQIECLNLDEASVTHLAKLPAFHRDPFDRMLICQSIEHGLTLVTVDDAIRQYPVSILKN
jgi:PIN domain nuclease of toxin-antitoxin system